MGKVIKWIVFYSLILCSGCSKHGELSKKEKRSPELNDFTGYYVSDGYEHREKGFDWLSIRIDAINDTIAKVSVRSRSDNKRPTCTFDSKAVFLTSSGQLETEFEGRRIIFDLDEDTLSVSVPDDDDHMILYIFSSGGSTLMGDYVKLKEPVHIDHSGYMKRLVGYSYSFDVQSKDSHLIVSSDGLSDKEKSICRSIKHKVVDDSSVADLDNDGFPELLIFLTCQTEKHEGDLIAYSVENGKTINEVIYSPLLVQQKMKHLYHGDDSFAVKNNILHQYIPVSDDNKEWVEDIRFKLISNNGHKQLVVDNVSI